MDVSKQRESFLPLAIAVVFIFAIWLGSGVAVWWFMPDWTARGAFGDMFGVVALDPET